MPLDYAARDYLSTLVRNAKRDCAYFNRYHTLLIPLLALLLTAPELAAVTSGYAALEAACQILQQIPDPRPE